MIKTNTPRPPAPSALPTSIRLPLPALSLIETLSVLIQQRQPAQTKPSRTKVVLMALDALHRELVP